MTYRDKILHRLRSLGYNGFAIEVLDNDGGRYWNSTASQAWLNRYVEAHATTDAVYEISIRTPHPLSWVDLRDRGLIAPQLIEEIAEVEQVYSGVSIPILAPSVRGFVEFFSPELPTPQELQRHHETMVRLSAIAYDLFDQIVMAGPEPPDSDALTAREIECLKWVAVGKSNWEVAQILHIAESTVKETLQRAGRRLGTTNRTHMVTRAIMQGLIDPTED